MTHGAAADLRGWAARNAISIVSVVFAVGMAYAQLSALAARVDAVGATVEAMREEVVEIRVNGLGVSTAVFNAHMAALAAIDARQEQETAFHRTRLIAIRQELQQVTRDLAALRARLSVDARRETAR